MDSSQTAPCACLPLFDSSPNPSKRCKPNSKCKPYSPPLTGSMPSDPGYVAAEDPLALALAPPPDETPEARAVRELAEAEAKRVSDGIDEQLKREREAERKKKRPVKLLLLGQSESGKTATLKNFQLTYARREWSAERPTWRAVVQLNLVRNATAILHILAKEMGSVHPYPPSNSNSTSSSYTNGPPSPASSTSSLAPRRAPALPPLHFSAIHRALQTRLAPLHAVQAALERKLGEGATELYSTTVSEAAPFGEGKDGAGGGGKEWIGMGMGSRKRRALQEFSINSTNGWKSALEKFRTIKRRRPGVDGDGEGEGGEGEEEREEDEDPGEVLESVREDIKVLWEDPVITEMLHRRKVRMEDSPGFFLNDTERVASRAYAPTDDDVVRARLRTLGVQEYRFIFDHGRTAGTEWHLYDVGGTRSSRVAWYPYFDDMDALIFLAPISPFDEKLAEDRRVNRLEDSYILWRSVCECKLLARTQIILFLNKCDLLQAKLQRGVRIRDSVPSYGQRKNDLVTATRYFQQHFKDISKQHSPVSRPFYMYLTSVIDTRSTAVTLGAVEESILREHLRHADLM